MNFGDLEFDFHVSRKTIPLIVKETCEAIWNGLHHQEMPTPDNEMWLRKAKEFNEITNYPHCIGAVDGKHVRLQCPPNTGSLYYNFKKFNSIVLMAVCDAKYYFTAIDVGAYGREGDSSIFKNSNFYKRLVSGQLDIPQDQCLPTNTQHPNSPKVPHVFLGDEAFGLSRHVLRQYPSKNLTVEKKIYNYRHCRARRTVECSFGILSNKWRVLHSCILVNPDFATVIVKCCCVLHNFVRRRDGYIFEDSLSCDMANLDDITAVGGRCNAIQIRDIFCDYFNGPGALPWQRQRI